MKRRWAKPGETVTLTLPRVVKRVGYPLDNVEAFFTLRREGVDIQAIAQAACESLRLRCTPSIVEPCGVKRIIPPYKLPTEDTPETREGLYHVLSARTGMGRILGALLGVVVEDRCFGGDERAIHFWDRPDLVGQSFEVREVLRRGVGGSDWDEDVGRYWCGYNVTIYLAEPALTRSTAMSCGFKRVYGGSSHAPRNRPPLDAFWLLASDCVFAKPLLLEVKGE